MAVKMKKPNIVVVIPARNEEKTIKQVIQETYKVNKKNKLGKMKILVVDDASIDDTGKIAKKYADKVVRGEGEGLGECMLLGLREALKFNPDIIVSIDADGQSDPKEIPNFVKPIINDKADMVIGSRFLKADLIKYKMEFSHLIGNKILAWFLRRITKIPITDSHGGIRAMRRKVVDKMKTIASHTYVQETVIDAVDRRFRIKEIPSIWRKRSHGETKVVHSIKKYIFWVLPVLLLRSGLFMKFFPIGIIVTLIGLFFGCYLVFVVSPGTPLGTNLYPHLILVTLIISIGFNLFLFGVLFNLIIQLRNKIFNLTRDRR